MDDSGETVRQEATDQSKQLVIPAYLSGLTLWAVFMFAPFGVLLAGAVMGGSEIWPQIVKFFIALLLAMIPGWIYLLFIKNKGQSLYDEYVLNLYRLKIDAVENLPAPPQHTNYFEIWNRAHGRIRRYLVSSGAARAASGRPAIPTKDNLYRKKFESIYGRGSVSTIDMIDGKQRLVPHTETFSPILFATVLICLGWVLVLPPNPGRVPGLEESFSPETFLALQFAFFGAYAFTLQDLVRRYFRDDLRAGAYIGLVVRIVFVCLLMTAISVITEASELFVPAPELLGGDKEIPLALIAFVVGFFPQAGLQLIIDIVRRPLGRFIPNLKTMHPLSEIDGLNVWYETRLSEEGIDDMQNLASANFVDLMLKTRAPVARLVDWMDQALLQLHAWPATLTEENGKRAKRSSSVERLRGLGIRTATDLERAWDERGNDPIFRRLVSRALNVTDEEGAAVVGSMLACLSGEANLWHIREFRRHGWLQDAPEGGAEGDGDDSSLESAPRLVTA